MGTEDLHARQAELQRAVRKAQAGLAALAEKEGPGRDDEHDDGHEGIVEEVTPEPQSDVLLFPQAAWRGPFGDYKQAMNGTSEAPDSAHFSTFWAVAAARLRRRVRIYYAYPHYANVFLVNYGPTGDSKTSAGRQGLRLLPEDGRVKTLRGVGSAEALGDWMKQPEDGPCVAHLLCMEELGTLLIRGSWSGSTLLSFLTETFDAPDVYEIPFRNNPVKVQEPTPTLLAGTTPEWFWKSMREIDVHGGFGNRLFFFTGTSKAPIAMPAKPDQAALGRVKQALHRLDMIEPVELFLSQEAQEVWQKFYLAWKLTQWDPLTAAAVKRIPAYMLKLAMLYACFEATIPTVTKDQVKAAIEVGHYGAKCAELLMQRHRQHTVQSQCEARVLKVLEHVDLPPWQIHRAIGGRFTAEELNRALRALLGAGTILKVGETGRNEPVLRRRDRPYKV